MSEADLVLKAMRSPIGVTGMVIALIGMLIWTMSIISAEPAFYALGIAVFGGILMLVGAASVASEDEKKQDEFMRELSKPKVTVDRSVKVVDRSVKVQDAVITGGKISPDNKDEKLLCCPYCGKDLDFDKTPRFCPYCKEKI
jgi:uncharacterized protein YacL